MPTPHNEAKKEDIAKVVIMPGDPKRAKYIAENYLDDAKLVNEVRGMLAYTGYYKGKRLTVMAHGMGIPSVAIYTYELFKFYDVDVIIRVGSAGAYTDELKLRDVILATESYSDTNYDMSFNNENVDIIRSNEELNNIIINKSKELDINLKVGRIYTSEAFYTQEEVYEKMYNGYGCLAVEMETFALLYNAYVLGKKATSILTISDSLVTKEETTSEERQNSFNNMLVLALESILEI